MKIYSKRTIVSNLEDLSWTRDSQYVARFPGQRYPNWRHYFPRYFTRLLEATTESAPLNERRILSGINLGGGRGRKKSALRVRVVYTVDTRGILVYRSIRTTRGA